jgi:hypothetical protein
MGDGMGTIFYPKLLESHDETGVMRHLLAYAAEVTCIPNATAQPIELDYRHLKLVHH